MDSQKLKAQMILANETQASLAAKIGMDVSTLSLKINGKRKFTIDEANKVADALHLSGADCTAIFFADTVA